jgi:hypothetical protein
VDALDLDKYVELLIRAASSVLSPFGIPADILREWSLSEGLQLHLPATSYLEANEG